MGARLGKYGHEFRSRRRLSRETRDHFTPRNDISKRIKGETQGFGHFRVGRAVPDRLCQLFS